MPKKLVFAMIACSVAIAAFPTKARDKETTILETRTRTFVNTDCRPTKSCSLKSVEYVAQTYKVGIGDEYNYGTRFFALYKTDSVASLKDYIFVQFIRGGMYKAHFENGKESFDYDCLIMHFGKPELFAFRNWTIDSDIADPAYSAFTGQASRHYACLWNLVPGSFAWETRRMYGQKPPPRPELYISDHPSQAFVGDNGAVDVSVEFRTCIYKAKDVPKTAKPDDTDFAKPLDCFQWRNSFVYNFH